MTRRTRGPEPPAAALALAALVVLVAGCARKLPPSGGPPDIEPPRIVGTSPDSGATGVPRDVDLSVTFSEAMDPRATASAVDVAPRVDVGQRRWSGRTLTLALTDSLAAAHTYTLFVGGDARDRHGNALRSGRAVAFTTAPVFPPGAISGTVEAVGFPGPGTYLWCYPEGRAPDSTARDFDAIGLAGDDGAFRVSGLSVPGRYRLWAFADLNHNHSFEPSSDLLVGADTTIALTADAPEASGLHLKVLNPRAPGRFKGAVLDSVSDGSGVLRLIVVSQRDSTRRLIYELTAPTAFDLQFDPGVYRVRAFRDLDRDKAWRPEREPASEERTITVPPGGTFEGGTFVLRRPGTQGGGP